MKTPKVDDKIKTFVFIWIFLLLLAIGFVVFSESLSLEARKQFLSENGPVENASWIAYFVAAFFVVLKTIKNPNRWSMAVAAMLLGMRELDFHERFTTMGIFKSRFFISPDVPVGEKLIALLVAAAIGVTLFFMAKNHLKIFVSRVRSGEGASLSFLLAGALMVFAKSIDGLSRKLGLFGIESSDATGQVFNSIEESFELTVALLIVVAAIAALRNRSKLD